MMPITSHATLALALAAAVGAFLMTGSGAQAQGAPTTTGTAPDVGQEAPDFTAPGATRYGLLRTPVKLSDYRGQTVVLAFFYKARTKG
jgi:peroxiredoxin Q/BCP